MYVVMCACMSTGKGREKTCVLDFGGRDLIILRNHVSLVFMKVFVLMI